MCNGKECLQSKDALFQLYENVKIEMPEMKNPHKKVSRLTMKKCLTWNMKQNDRRLEKKFEIFQSLNLKFIFLKI